MSAHTKRGASLTPGERSAKYGFGWVRIVQRVAVWSRQINRADARDGDSFARKRDAMRRFGISGKRFRALERKARRERRERAS